MFKYNFLGHDFTKYTKYVSDGDYKCKKFNLYRYNN